MKTTIYLTRHGETIWNIEKRLQGWNNSPLTNEGVIQAENLANKIKDIKIDVIYSSPSERAYETAKILRGSREIEITTHEGLKEMGFGLWEGLLWDEIESSKEYGLELYNLYNSPKDYKPFGGETLEQFGKRAKEAIEYIISENSGKDVFIVTHGMTLKLLIGFFEKMQDEDSIGGIVMGQTSLTKVIIEDDTYKIEFKNDTSHYDNGYIRRGW